MVDISVSPPCGSDPILVSGRINSIYGIPSAKTRKKALTDHFLAGNGMSWQALVECDRGLLVVQYHRGRSLSLLSSRKDVTLSRAWFSLCACWRNRHVCEWPPRP